MEKNTVKLYFEKKIFYVQTELIKDFLFSILDKIEKTYLGDDIMTIDSKVEHFGWCLDEVIKMFSQEDIKFKKTKDFQTKLFDIFNKFYYNVKKDKACLENLKSRFTNNISCATAKTVGQIEEVVWYHKLFTEALGE
jgi:hypothetical protein